MAKPRNKVAALPLELRSQVINLMLDGATYDQIREDLSREGVTPATMPSNSSFLAYRKGTEYCNEHARRMQWRDKAREKKAIWEACLSGGGASGLANIAIFEALDQLLDQLRTGETEDVPRVASAISGLKRTLIHDEMASFKRDLQARADRIAADAQDNATVSDPAAVMDALDQLLGVKK